MHYASVDNISKSFGARTLFDSISFHIEEGDKIALIARNGSGKSTLLNIIAGLDTPDSGTIWVHKDVKVVLLPQESAYDPAQSVWDNLLSLDHPVIRAVKAYEEYLEAFEAEGAGEATTQTGAIPGNAFGAGEAAAHAGATPGNAGSSADADRRLGDLFHELDRLDAWQFEAQVKQILGRLNLHHLQAPMRQLSGGQRKRVALAQALLETQLHGPQTLLLMDEPTNHLDVHMIEWLQEYLSAARCTVLLVTHDRYFLDNVCNEILELDPHTAYVYRGDYDYFLTQKVARQESDAATGSKNQNLYRKELEWMRKQPKARTTKSRAREDNFHALEDKVRQRGPQQDLSLQAKMTRLGGKVMEMKKVYKAYGANVILKDFDYTFKRGERIGIAGPNGVGKSTFIRLLLGLEQADSGKINPGDTVVFGHFSQEGLEWKEDMRVIEYVKTMAEFFPLADGTKIGAAQFLQLFAFPPEQQYTYLSRLSGGEKKRLQLLTILFRNPNFLVLDEPTNDLDLQTLRILEDFLVDFGGCLLIVSHDRYFMDRVVDHLFVFEGEGKVRDFPGNYTQYREALKEEAASVGAQAAGTGAQAGGAGPQAGGTGSQAAGAGAKSRGAGPQAGGTGSQAAGAGAKGRGAGPQAAGVGAQARGAGPQPGGANGAPSQTPAGAKLTFKEKREFEQLGTELPALEKEKQTLEEKMGDGGVSYAQLQAYGARIQEIVALLEEKEMRWLELSERQS